MPATLPENRDEVSYPARTPSTRFRAGRSTLLICLVASALTPLTAHRSEAQSVQAFFPSGNTGYDQELGVTVLSRLRPLFEPQGVSVGAFTISPTFDQSLIENTNVTGSSNSGGFGSQTSAGVSAASDWVRNSLNATAGVTQNVYASNPGISYTDWNVGLGGGYTIGRSELSVDYSHQSFNQLGTTIGYVTSDTPILDQTDTINSAYTFDLGLISLTPNISASAYRYGDATVDGVSIDQSNLNRNVIAGGLTGRYTMDQQGSLLVVVQGVGTSYTDQNVQPDQSSDTFLALGGIDYQAKGLFRYQFLAGVERRSFVDSQFGTRVEPVLQGNVIYSPTGLTTVTGTVSREIDDPQSAGTNGFTLTDIELRIDHELLPNVFLQAHGGFQIADYLQGGSQTAYTLGAGANWLLNRRVRLSLDFDYHQQTGIFQPIGQPGPSAAVTNSFIQDLATLTLHLAL